jgi:putative PIN family toxin of toxin-antitoxin system
VFDLVLSGDVILFVSTAVMEEYTGVLARKKFHNNKGFHGAAKNLLESLSDISVSVNPKVSLNILPDKSDNKFLELALVSQADFLITGNIKHFPLEQFESTKILSPNEYWDKNWK